MKHRHTQPRLTSTHARPVSAPFHVEHTDRRRDSLFTQGQHTTRQQRNERATQGRLTI